MKTVILFCAISVALVNAVPTGNTKVGILEDEITQALRDYLAAFDPHHMSAITDLNITTDHSSILYSSIDNEFIGLSNVECTSFTPPVPLVSKHVSMTLRFANLDAHSPSYSMKGTFQGESYEAAGVGDLNLVGLQFTAEFHAASYGIEPVSVCVEAGTFKLDLLADSIVANFVGADEINDDINQNAEHLLEQMEDQFNAKSADIEQAINDSLCKE